ncbi:hypothetical protein SODALDRAFT_318822 [Sodiomyces alkalinus F11]|uniref:Mediator of RNA polymerase II transcription subunit 11 n=1 Tax=Sodiomyces alkalinus (strain CBS 110278 / VKM F-3762 / F11) TaxID=1314773 RepID=A0A3N2Q5X3_SODAK|nr:hypothetical protein SODALDRAFT_318822 [Sodiomyces alkalinus F11]ROT42058.1 hypothetical protein SODALDRAFT_318822 [Sodiomyces alkalinus F11]
MASNTTPANSNGAAAASTNQGSWDEERLRDAMEHLKLLHIKLRDLRTTIPRMLQPLTEKQPSPEALFHSFSDSVNNSYKEVQEFTEMKKDAKTRQILEHAAQRRKEEPQGIKLWRSKDHPDWMTIDSSS